MTAKYCWIVATLLACAGCQSKIGSFYGAATGKTDASDLAPASRLQRNNAIASAPPRAASALPGADGKLSAVSQTSFAPPPLDPVSPLPEGVTPPTNTPPTATTVRRDPLPEPTKDEALVMILGDLQQIGAENPAAQQELLRQLQEAQPGHWPLIVKRFQSTLAYHEQLKRSIEQDEEAEPRTMQASHSHQPGGKVQESAQGTRTQPQEHRPQYSEPMTPQGSSAPYPNTHSTTQADHQATIDSPADRVVQQVSAESPVEQRARPGQPEKPVQPLVINMPTRDWRMALEEAIALLESDSPTDPHTTDEAYRHARLRLLALAAGDLDRSVAAIPGLSATEQDYWSKQLFAVSTMLDTSSQPELNRRAAAAGLHLAAAQEKLQQMGSLAVRNLTFCEEVFAFGAYKERQSHKFKAGEEVTLYVEVENFRTEETNQGNHTVIGTSYQVLDDRGNRVDSREFPAVDDYCLSRRRDFHIQYGIALPDRVYPGKYQLELTLTDQLGNKIGKAAVDFEIVDDGK